MEQIIKYEATCLITGKREDLCMYAHRNEKGEMVGWIFLHKSIKMEDIESDITFKYKVSYENVEEIKNSGENNVIKTGGYTIYKKKFTGFQ